MNLDKFGLPTMTVEENGYGEAGDTSQRYGFLWLGIALQLIYKVDPIEECLLDGTLAKPSRGLDLLECPKRPGDYRRHPEGDGYWYSECGESSGFLERFKGRMTRDQSTGILGAFVAGRILRKKNKSAFPFHRHSKRAWKFGWNMFKRVGLTNNYAKGNSTHGMGDGFPDWFGLPQWASWIRSLPWVLRVPIGYIPLCILDVEILVNTIGLRNKPEGDVSSYTARMLAAKFTQTPLSIVAWKLAPVEYMADKIQKTADFDPKNEGFMGPPMNNVITLNLLKRLQKVR